MQAKAAGYVGEMDAEASAAMIAALAALVALLFAARSARASQRAADYAETVAQIEREHRHDLLNPEGLTPFSFKLEIGAIFGREFVMGSFSPPRTYQVQMITYPHVGEPKIHDVQLAHAHHVETIPIESYPAINGADCPSTTAIRLRFWPPRPEDDTDHWSCLCGRPEAYDPDGLGHWEVYMKVPASPITARQDPNWAYRGSGRLQVD